MTDVDSLFNSIVRLIEDSYNTMDEFIPIINLTLDGKSESEKLALASQLSEVGKQIDVNGDTHYVPLVSDVCVTKILTSVRLNERYYQLISLKKALEEDGK